MTETTLEGGCFCGAIRFRITGPFTNQCLCHCESCRRAAGAPFVAWCTVSRENFDVHHGELTVYRSSKGVQRGFCKQCGTSITYSNEARNREIDVALAALDDPEALQPKFQIFVNNRLDWIDTNKELPQYDTLPDKRNPTQ